MRSRGITLACLAVVVLTAASCGDPARETRASAPPKPGASDPSTTIDALPSIGSEGGSVRGGLTGGHAAIAATVRRVDGTNVDVVIDEVLTPGEYAGEYDECPVLRIGQELRIQNATKQFANDLIEQDRALFVGNACNPSRPTIQLEPFGPNGRKIVDDRVDLGSGDVVSMDEARSLAGAGWRPQEPLVNPPTVKVAASGSRIEISISGVFEGKLGAARCPAATITTSSRSADIMGPCTVLDPTNRGDNGAPTLYDAGTAVLAYEISDDDRRGNDLVIIGDTGTNMHVISVESLASK